MTHESVDQKASRLLVSGALTVLEVRPGAIRAHCQGDSGRLHRLGWWRGQWGCSCRSGQLRGTCSHLEALRRVVAAPELEDAGLTPARLRREQDEAVRVRNGSGARRSA